MVSMIHLWIFVLLLITNSVNATNVEHESGLRERNNLNRRQVYERVKRRRGRQLQKTGTSKSGKGNQQPTPTPPPTPRPTPDPTPGPTPPPTPGPTTGSTPPPTPPPTPGPTPPPTPPPTPGPTDSVSFMSFVRVEVETTDGTNPSQGALDNIAALTVNTYNSEKDNCADPLARRMTDAQFFSLAPVLPADVRRMNRRTKTVIKGDQSERRLQNLNIFIFLRVSGQCNGCQNNPFFFNQVVDRRLQECSIVTPDAFLGTFNNGLNPDDFGNVANAQSVKDVSEPKKVKQTKGKGKGKSDD